VLCICFIRKNKEFTFLNQDNKRSCKGLTPILAAAINLEPLRFSMGRKVFIGNWQLQYSSPCLSRNSFNRISCRILFQVIFACASS